MAGQLEKGRLGARRLKKNRHAETTIQKGAFWEGALLQAQVLGFSGSLASVSAVSPLSFIPESGGMGASVKL
jgi:hypothetical protein